MTQGLKLIKGGLETPTDPQSETTSDPLDLPDSNEERRKLTIGLYKKDIETLQTLSESEVIERFRYIRDRFARAQRLLCDSPIEIDGVWYLETLHGTITVRDALKKLFLIEIKDLLTQKDD